MKYNVRMIPVLLALSVLMLPFLTTQSWAPEHPIPAIPYYTANNS